MAHQAGEPAHQFRRSVDNQAIDQHLGRERDLDRPAAKLASNENPYPPHETIRNAEGLAELGVEFIEQPLVADDWDGMKRVYRDSALPVVADETLLNVLREREYVRVDKKRLHPEDKGRLVTAFLESFFKRYVETMERLQTVVQAMPIGRS